MELDPEVLACPHVTGDTTSLGTAGAWSDSPLDPTPCTVPGTQKALKQPSFDEEITLLHRQWFRFFIVRRE